MTYDPENPWRVTQVSVGGAAGVLGQWHADVRWNGWLCPSIDALAVEVILTDLAASYAAANDPDAPTWEWADDGTLLVTDNADDAHYTERYEPDADGLYALGAYGWCWEHWA